MEPTPSPPPRRRGPLIVAGVLAVLVLGGVALAVALIDDDGVDRIGASSDQSSDAPVDITEDGSVPPSSFEYWDGGEGSLTDFEGQPLVVNFFASWCVPCVDEMPQFEQVHQELGDEVQFLGMNYQDRLEDAEGIIDHTGITYDVARDDGALLQALEGVIMPTTAFITDDGRVVRIHSGQMSADQLRTTIQEELLR